MNRLFINDDYIKIVWDRQDEDVKELLTSIKFVHSNRSGTELFTSSRNIDTVLYGLRNISSINKDTLPTRLLQQYDTELQRRQITELLLKYGPDEESDWLMKHQQLGVELARVNKRWGFFYDTRTGKTPMGLKIINEDVVVNPSHKWLVICPSILINNAWLEDREKFFPAMNIINTYANTPVKRIAAMQQPGNVYITNTESLSRYVEYFVDMHFEGVVLDESSSLKSNSSLTSKAALKLSQAVNRWYLLSGTPAPNGEYEYYTQLKTIDPFCLPQSYTKFTDYFFDDISHNRNYKKLIPKQDKRDELQSIIKQYSLYMDKEDVLKTPGRDFIQVPVEMPLSVRKVYNDMAKKMATEINGKEITVETAASKVNKLNQISSGFMIDTEVLNKISMANKFGLDVPTDKPLIHLSNFKFDALMQLLEKCGDNQVIIWANYHHEFDCIKALLGECCVVIRGGMTPENKDIAVQAFKTGKVQYLLANPASADKGLTLTNSHLCIYFSLNYSYELFKQSMERIYGGTFIQPNRCTYYLLQTTDTVNGVLYDVLQNKKDISMALLNYLKGGNFGEGL